MMVRLTVRQIKYAVDQAGKGRRTSHIASELGVSQRRIQQLHAEFRRTGRPGRRAMKISREQTRMVLDQHKRQPVGMLRAAKSLRQAGQIIRYSAAYRICRTTAW